jgi:putative ABC transport system permease protein
VRLVWSQLRFRPGRPLALALAILAAAVSFTLLTAAARTSTLELQGTVESNYRAAYDVLVRPPSAVDARERSQRLVRPNFLSGIFGGISLRQYEEIKGLPGVEVAAPIANVGYIYPGDKPGVRINEVLDDEPVQLYRIRRTWLAHNGTSRYVDVSNAYVYFTRRHKLNEALEEIIPGRAEPVPVCRGIYESQPLIPGPFDARPYMACYSALSPEIKAIPQLNNVLRVGEVGNEVTINYPVIVAAIDPVQESRLLDLDEAIIRGRYLRPGDGPIEHQAGYRTVPAIASARTYADERLVLDVERLRIPPGTDVPTVLASMRARDFLEGLEGRVVKRRTSTLQELYGPLARGGIFGSFSIWTVGDVRYKPGARPLRPLPTTNSISVWESPFLSGGPGGRGYWTATPSNADLQFRKLVSHPKDNRCDRICRGATFDIVGLYDPEKLPGFSPLSAVPLETYYPPLLEPADERSRAILDGKPLLPTQNLGDYIQQPPLVLVTLEGMRPFLNPTFYWRSKGRLAAPISAIRVRVKDVTGPDELSLTRIRTVAAQIRERTGLAVDITAGSSPKPLLVELPAGKFGRPELLLREGWSKKGAAVTFVNAIDRKSVAVFALVLVICALFLSNGALASVRTRRAEIGTLLTLGWSRHDVFRVVLSELVVIGALAGLVGLAISALVVWLFSLQMAWYQIALVLPLAVALAALAGLVPAWKAASGRPLDALRPPVALRTRRRRVHTLLHLALANLRRLPARTAVGASGLVVGVAALTVLLAIQQAFQGVLVDTLLGQAISIQVRGADIAAVVLTIVLAGVSVADVLALNLRERAAEIVTLRTVGWSERQLASVVAMEALGLGALGSLVGAVVGVALGLPLGLPAVALVPAALFAALGGVVVALIASLVPLLRLSSLTAPMVLAEE